MADSKIQPLITEYENAKIIDFRDPANPNNTIALTCEHATNVLPQEYKWTDNDLENFANSHWGWDPAALDVAMYLAQELKCILIHSLYSRLLVDVDRDITSDSLFRQSGDGKNIDLNQNMSKEEEHNRIIKYHMPYYNALREVSEKVDPTITVSIHSFTPIYEGNVRDMEVGVLFTDSEELGQRVYEEVNERRLIARMNEPYYGEILNAMNSVLRANYPVRREAFCYEIRNDLIQDEERALTVKKNLLDALRTACRIDEKANYMGC